MSAREFARRRVPTKINPKYRRPLETGVKGDRPTDPLLIGEPDESDPVLVEANGMRVGPIRKGDQRWVTGDGVQPAIENEWLVVIADEEVSV